MANATLLERADLSSLLLTEKHEIYSPLRELPCGRGCRVTPTSSLEDLAGAKLNRLKMAGADIENLFA